MSPEQASQIIVSRTRADIAAAVQRSVSALRTGKPATARDPFSGRERPLPFPPHLKTLAESLAAAGLNTNDAVLNAIGDLAAEVARQPLFNFFAALDGEGAVFSDEGEEVPLELRLKGGERVATDLHERFLNA